MAAAGVSSAFDFGFDLPTPPFANHPSVAHFTPPRRPDTPQLTLHNYRKFQLSPQLSSSPELDYKRVRRKASVANLAASPEQHAPFAWTTSCAPPTFFHSFAPHDLAPSFLPPPPRTPHVRANTSSPSLSSTVTTLQSTPTQTPILRGHSNFERRRVDERRVLAEPIRSKRKFHSLKQAKRLPRRVDSGSGNGDGGLWEVHAAILDPPEQEAEEVEVTRQWPLAGADSQAEARRRPGKAVTFENTETENRVAPEESEKSLDVHEEKEPLATSSFSLSKFEFPVPPGHDNWGGTRGDLTVSSSPQSPATLHYHGASFDLVNPHASLLLGGHDFETPAEIDGLLDDYFDNRSEEDVMSYGRVPWSPSGQSLGGGSDSSRHTRVLYDDAASARRMIMRVEDEVPPPPKVVLSDSPLGYKSRSVSPMDATHKTAPLPFRSAPPQQNTNPFSNLSSISRVLGWDSGDQERKNLSKLEEGMATTFKGAEGGSKPSLNVTGASRLMRSFSRRKGRAHASDPFDLTLSEDGGGSKPNIFSVIQHSGHRVENEPTDRQRVEQTDFLAPDGPNSQATSTEQDTDPTLKEILDGYDYTRINQTPSHELSASPPIERGMIITRGDELHNDGSREATSLTTPKPFVTQNGTLLKAPPPPNAPLPTPPAPIYRGQLRVHSGCSELPTSEQTYGETSHLLHISPEPEIRYPPYRPHSPCHPATCAIPGHFHVHEDHRRSHEIPANHLRQYCHDDKKSNSPASSHDSEASQEEARGFPHGFEDNFGDIGQARHFFEHGDDNNNGVIDRNLVRASSIFTGDDESAWETQFEESQPVLQHATRRTSLDSYADTSVDGTNRFSVGQEAYKEPPPAIFSPGLSHAKDEDWDRDRRVTFQLEDDGLDVKKAISLLSDKILTEQVATKFCGSPDIEKEQRTLDLMELERLRRRNPSAIRDASIQLADKSGEFYPKMFKKIAAHARSQEAKAVKPKIESRNSFMKSFKPRKNKSPADPASDRRALLAMSPSPASNNLQFDSSMNTFVTIRDDPIDSHPGNPWWPHGQDPTMHALKLPSPLPSVEDIMSGRKALDINRDNGKSKRASRIFNGASKPVELKLLRPAAKTKDWHPLTDQELASRLPNWQENSNLRPDGALATYAMREDVRRAGPVDPRLPSPKGRFFPEDPLFNKGYLAEREIISKTVAVQCCIFPPLSLAFALGYFDWIIERKTCGRIKKMSPKAKAEAFKYHFSLGCLAWAIIIVLIVIFVEWFKKYNGGNSSPLY